jgi:hypothetical protein
MYCLVMFFCNGLLVYWATRTALLLHGPEERIERTLEKDLWSGRQALIGIRRLLMPPANLAG